MVRGDAARERFSTGSTEDDLAEQSLEPAPQVAPRPEGAYPRSIEHQERVEYSYNPSTEEFAARVVSSSKPVVTDWDYSPPQQDEREVGTCAVTPTEDGVTAQNQGRVEVPENVKERLRAEADEAGEAVSTTTTLRYQHDLDTRATQSRVPRPSVAERAAALRERSQRQGQKDGELSPQYQKEADSTARTEDPAAAAVKQQPPEGKSGLLAPADRGGARGRALDAAIRGPVMEPRRGHASVARATVLNSQRPPVGASKGRSW